MDMHRRKRIDIILEAPALNRLLDMFDASDVSGYTVLPALAGLGQHGRWSREGLATDAGRMVAVMIVTREERMPKLLDSIYAIVSRQIGIVLVSDVEVIRGERF